MTVLFLYVPHIIFESKLAFPEISIPCCFQAVLCSSLQCVFMLSWLKLCDFTNFYY